MNVVDVEDEEEKLSESEKIIRKKRDYELDNLLRVHKELEDQEKEAEIGKVTLATQSTLFPLWSIQRIQKEVVDDPSTHCLEPSVSFELDNTSESQLDFLITRRAFLFNALRRFREPHFLILMLIIRSSLSISSIKSLNFEFAVYKRSSQWRFMLLFPADNFINIKFKWFGGTNRIEFEFTLADLPYMNPHDWICLFLILSKDVQKF